jgi:hypothetical protein
MSLGEAIIEEGITAFLERREPMFSQAEDKSH